MKHKSSLTALPPVYASNLARLAPAIAFSVSRTLDPHFRWNGDGPDPVDDGFDAYDVDFTARAIVDGEIVEGSASLGGSYFRDDEPTGEVNGYLNQKLEEAAQDLCDTLSRIGAYQGGVLLQLADARAWLKEQGRAEYDAQMAGKV